MVTKKVILQFPISTQPKSRMSDKGTSMNYVTQNSSNFNYRELAMKYTPLQPRITPIDQSELNAAFNFNQLKLRNSLQSPELNPK